jgi:hypothetical protein
MTTLDFPGVSEYQRSISNVGIHRNRNIEEMKVKTSRTPIQANKQLRKQSNVATMEEYQIS